LTIIECSPDLDIATAADFHQRLLGALKTGEPLEIDSQAVRKIHAAVLQLLLSVVIEAQARALPVRWRNPSPALVESARLLGLADRLGLADAASG
jgi:anti-anti-sigma regulatory factor